MTTTDQIEYLVRSHYARDDASFRRAVLLIASRIKDEKKREALVKQTERLVELPQQARDLVHALPMSSLDELVLERDLLRELDEVVLEAKHRLALLERGIRPREALLFCGPPGNGKTTAAAALIRATGAAAYGVSMPRARDSLLGGTGQNLSKLFQVLESGAGLVFDEIDALGTSRDNTDGAAGSREQNATVNSLLTLMDARASGIVIATTNRIDLLDAALVRRFDTVLEFPKPSYSQKLDLLAKLGERYGVEGTTEFYADEIWLKLESCDAITKEVISRARKRTIAEILQNEKNGKGSESCAATTASS